MNGPATPGEKPLNLFLIDDDDVDAMALERAWWT
jgi:hypothetical protein